MLKRNKGVNQPMSERLNRDYIEAMTLEQVNEVTPETSSNMPELDQFHPETDSETVARAALKLPAD